MGAITLSGLSAPEAEDLIARVWILLEKHQLASPRVISKSQSDDFKIEFLFRSQGDLDVIRSTLQSLPFERRENEPETA